MKKALVLLFICFRLKAICQDTTNNFHVAKGDVVWQKIYQTNKGFSDVWLSCRETGIFEKIDTVTNKMFAEFRQFDVDNKGAGYAASKTPTYLGLSHINAFAVITKQEGSYIVTVKKIVFEQSSDVGIGILKFAQGEKTPLEDYALTKKNIFKGSFKGDASKIMDYTFNKMFSFLIN